MGYTAEYTCKHASVGFALPVPHTCLVPYLLSGLACIGRSSTSASATACPSVPPRRPGWRRKGFYRIFLYKIQPNQLHTVLLYNRGTEPRTILDGHPGRPGGLYKRRPISGGPAAYIYTNEAAISLFRKIPRARIPREDRARTKV